VVYHTYGYGGKVTKTLTGVEVGKLMSMWAATCLKRAPANWQQGFCILHAAGPYVRPEIIPILNRKFPHAGITSERSERDYRRSGPEGPRDCPQDRGLLAGDYRRRRRRAGDFAPSPGVVGRRLGAPGPVTARGRHVHSAHARHADRFGLPERLRDLLGE